MKRIKSKSDKRLIIDVEMNGKQIPMLVDTGATVALISDKLKGLAYDTKRGDVPLQGVGGKAEGKRVITMATINGKPLSQFVATDIRHLRDSIFKETNIYIEGIISLPQMRFVGMAIDTTNNEISIP